MDCQTLSLSGFGWNATISAGSGANILLLTCHGEHVLRPLPNPCPDPYTVGSPLLFPANRTANGCFDYEGRKYALTVNDKKSGANLHGFLFRQSFSVDHVASDTVELHYENRKEIYPFPFRISVTYHIEEGSFLSRYQIKNTGTMTMPFTFGLHTTFPEPDRFQVPLESRQEKTENHIPTGRYVPLDMRERHYCTGSPSRGLEISGYYKAAGACARIGKKLLYQTEGFDHWVLYNGGGDSGFLCIEPQCGGVNGLNLPNCPVLEPGQSREFQTCLRLQA